jgi:ATP-dependent helicase/nuclease subunit A
VVRPSDPVSDNPHPVNAQEQLRLRARALQRGTLVHRLLQSLPDVDSAKRGVAAGQFLARARDAATWSDEERAALARQVLALLNDPRFAAAFAAGSRAEASIIGRLTRPGGGTVLVNGQIDRLVVTQDTVLIVDFKTNHVPPRNPADVPVPYRRQLALYRAVLAKIHPDRSVRAALIWTELPEMMELSAHAMDAELASALA